MRGRGCAFDLLLVARIDLLVDRAAALGEINVVDFYADRARVDGPSFASILAFALEFGGLAGTEKPRGQVAF